MMRSRSLNVKKEMVGSEKKNKSSSIIFVCVKYGLKYGPEYVNRLYHQLKKSTSDYYQLQKKEKEEVKEKVEEKEKEKGKEKEEEKEKEKEKDKEKEIRKEKKSTHENEDLFRFVCYTDDDTDLCAGIEVHFLPVKRTQKNTNPDRCNTVADKTNNEQEVVEKIVIEERVKEGVIEDEKEVVRGKKNNQTTIKNNMNSKMNDLIKGMEEWKGWWYKAYLFEAVQHLIDRKSVV